VGDFEGCLSLPLFNGKVYRSTEVHVQAYNLQGKLDDYQVDGWLARVFQHEIDHLDGLLYTDRLRPEDNLIKTDAKSRRRAINSLAKLAE
jgi:peptide deformylase